MRYAAFLRAINVGTHNRIKMAVLRELCEAAGLRDVSTYLQTGNILFAFDGDAESAAQTIESALVAHGLKNAPAVVRSLPELEDLLKAKAFDRFPADEFTRFVTLFRNDFPADTEERLAASPYLAGARKREILSVLPANRPQGIDLNGQLSKAVKLDGTTRYLHVVEEVARLLRG